MPRSSKAALTPKFTRLERLKQFQAERNLSGPAELGRAIGRRTNQTSDLLHGRAPFGERIARAIEQFAGLPAGWLDQAEAPPGPAVKAARVQPAAGADPQVIAAQPLGGATAASGAAPTSAQQPVRAPLLLTREWVRAVTTAADPQLHFLHMPDESMAPLLARGDLLLIDSSVGSFGRDGIYVLHGRGRLLERQLRARLDGRVEVSAGTAVAGSSELATAGALRLVGQAVWVWRGQPL